MKLLKRLFLLALALLALSAYLRARGQKNDYEDFFNTYGPLGG